MQSPQGPNLKKGHQCAPLLGHHHVGEPFGPNLCRGSLSTTQESDFTASLITSILCAEGRGGKHFMVSILKGSLAIVIVRLAPNFLEHLVEFPVISRQLPEKTAHLHARVT